MSEKSLEGRIREISFLYGRASVVDFCFAWHQEHLLLGIDPYSTPAHIRPPVNIIPRTWEEALSYDIICPNCQCQITGRTFYMHVVHCYNGGTEKKSGIGNGSKLAIVGRNIECPLCSRFVKSSALLYHVSIDHTEILRHPRSKDQEEHLWMSTTTQEMFEIQNEPTSQGRLTLQETATLREKEALRKGYEYDPLKRVWVLLNPDSPQEE